jgi:hypothetical protein
MPAWAKAPRTDQAASTRAETHDFLTAGLTPVDCHGVGTDPLPGAHPVQCANRVLVKKTSAAHTSVQWTTHPATSCPEFAARVAAGELTARIDTCPKLRASIEHAVAEGLVEVPDA